MAQEGCWNVLCGHWWSPDLGALGLRVCHTAFDAGTNHLEFKLGEDACHLQEGGRHSIEFPAAAINGDAADDDQAQMLVLDDVDNRAQLLCAAGET